MTSVVNSLNNKIQIRKKSQAITVLAFLFLSSCFWQSDEVYLISGQTMGTTYSVKIASSSVEMIDLKQKIEEALKEVNRQMSTYIEDSEISKLNQASSGVPLKISPWFGKVLSYSLDLAQKTNGSYDPTLGPLINLWGFGPNGNQAVPEKTKIQEALSVVGYKKVDFKSENGLYVVSKKLDGVYVDLSSSAKGFGVDVLSELLKDEGHKNHLVEIGGELRASGHKFGEPWLIAVEKPSSSGRTVQKVFALKNLSIATSGDYRNFFNAGNKKYSHTLDVETGEPVQHKLASVSVLDPECMKADALATALMSMGPEKAQDFAKDENLAVYMIFEGVKGDLQTFSSEKFLSLTGAGAK
jgi:thiamine biosynthesis lipoprotein